MPCSYCNQPGHNINLCNHPTIITIFQRAKNIYLNIFTAHFNSDDLDDSELEGRFNNIIDRNFRLSGIRVVAIKFANARARYNKQQCISALWFYFRINIIHPEERLWLQTRQTNRFVEPDPIPAFAQDLAHPTNNDSDDEDDLGLTWYVDRTPQIQPQIDLRNYRIPVPLPLHVPVLDVQQMDRISLSNLYTQHLEQRTQILTQMIAQNRQQLDQRIQQNRQQLDQRIQQKFDINIIIALDDIADETEDDCPICLTSINPAEIIKLNCNHKFCGCCIKQSMIKYTKQTCALCREPTTTVSIKTEKMYTLMAKHCN
jgi:hypothetical protein